MAKRNTKVYILRVGDRVIKIPLSFGAWREMQSEREGIKKAKNDYSFSQHVLEYKYFLGLPITQYLQLFNNEKNNNLIEEYFRKIFADKSTWVNKKIKYLLEADIFLNFIKDNISENYNFLETFLDNNQLPQSSAHGDFHQDNILVKNDKLYFIDWSRFNVNSSRYFDLIDYYIFSIKKESESWMDIWLKKLDKLPENIFGIGINELYWHSYAIWKISDEIKVLKLRNSFNKYKRKKYIKFINKFFQVLKTKYERK